MLRRMNAEVLKFIPRLKVVTFLFFFFLVLETLIQFSGIESACEIGRRSLLHNDRRHPTFSSAWSRKRTRCTLAVRFLMCLNFVQMICSLPFLIVHVLAPVKRSRVSVNMQLFASLCLDKCR